VRGGLRAYAGAPLRLQHESGECVGLGSLCVSSSKCQDPLTKPQQQTLARLADWVASDIIQCARERRQRERRKMSELIFIAQGETDGQFPEKPVLRILRATYPDATISLQPSQASHIEVEGRDPIPLSDLEEGLWEDIDYIDDFIAKSNHKDLPSNRVVRIIAAQCESISGPSLLVVSSKDFRLVFDDIDSWFVQTCATIVSQSWNKRILAEVMRAKENFLRGFSHHLRTPIHGILGSVELLAEELKSRSLYESAEPISKLLEVNPAIKHGKPSLCLENIKMAGQDLISIVNSMITLNRWADIAVKDRHYATHTIDELEAELSANILKMFSGDTRYRASIFFIHDPSSDSNTLRVDLNLLRDCLLPLIINAFQHTPDGIVVVTTLICTESKELTIDVEDTGRGIPLDDQQRIFESYEKVDIHSTGAGLGLSLASKFATLLHGSVSLISSTINVGSHFKATFREVEFTSSTPSSQLPVSKNLKLPTRFYNMTSGSDSVNLCDHFIRFLGYHGFTASDITEDSLIIFDFVPGLEKCLSQIPSEQVAICLVPASEEQVNLEQISNNVVFIKEPFLTSTMNSALEEADDLFSRIKGSQATLLRLHEPLHEQPRLVKDPAIQQRAEFRADSIASKSQSVPVLINDSVGPVLNATVPLTQDSEHAAPANKTTIPTFLIPRTLSRPTALLVDDNVVNLRILEMYCSKRGLQYHSATGGQQAVEIFSQHQSFCANDEGTAIQLIFMDLQMPVCNGIEATRQIRLLERKNDWKESTLFIVTGQDTPTDREAAEGAGADEYFVKPVGMKQFDGGVKRYFPAFERS
jgi:signal transduction histidine kinase/ActR/RegA family two-component response regulator